MLLRFFLFNKIFNEFLVTHIFEQIFGKKFSETLYPYEIKSKQTLTHIFVLHVKEKKSFIDFTCPESVTARQ